MLTGACGDCPDPVGGSFAQPVPAWMGQCPSLVRSGSKQGSRDEICFKTTEKEGLPTEVLEFAGREGQIVVPALVPILPCAAHFA